MEQLTLFGKVHFNEAMDFIQMLEECRADYLCEWMDKFDKPVGLPWEVWYAQVIGEKK